MRGLYGMSSAKTCISTPREQRDLVCRTGVGAIAIGDSARKSGSGIGKGNE